MPKPKVPWPKPKKALLCLVLCLLAYDIWLGEIKLNDPSTMLLLVHLANSLDDSNQGGSHNSKEQDEKEAEAFSDDEDE